MHIVYTARHARQATERIVVDGQLLLYEETPQRVEIVRVALQAAGLGTWYEPLDHGLAPIQAVHDPDFLDFLRTIYALAFLRALEH